MNSMNVTRRAGIALALGLTSSASIARAGSVDIRFEVTVPPTTPAGAVLYLAGGAAEIGGWRADGLALRRREDGVHVAEAKLQAGATIEFKVTRGSWDTVEKAAGGAEVSNRVLHVTKAETIRIEVAAWADGGKLSDPKAAAAPRGAMADGASDQDAAKRRSTRTGDVRLVESFESKHLGNSRPLIVYLPPDYEKNVEQRYPVLYMHDGQNLFDAATSFIGVEWGVDEAAERLIRAGRIPPMIVVGIYNTSARMDEYTMSRDARRNGGGRGELYARFVTEEVKPFIDRTYRTRPGRADTGVAGSSLGGLVSLYMCQRNPELFSRCGVISPALWWDDRRIIALVEQRDGGKWLRDMRLWLDMGTAEGSQLPTFNRAIADCRALVKVFDQAGLVPGAHFYYAEVADAVHNEGAWAARIDQILLYFYGW